MAAPAFTPDGGSEAPTSPLGALSQLVQDHLDTGISLRRLGERATDPETGESISWQYFQKLVKNPPASPPDPAQMRALAAALGKPYRRIQEAAAKQWLQFEASELAGYDEDVRIIVAHLAGKTASDKRRWRRMIEAEEQAIREVDE
ncbi:XRE family transcriptional regulator [Streptomyces prasinus]|uniref:XRE family transcriptional regulator n=1 Tax=Streptomyces prasinus TaxID=67345 RepID=UPI0033AF4D7E